jgi:hypothetical protein
MPRHPGLSSSSSSNGVGGARGSGGKDGAVKVAYISRLAGQMRETRNGQDASRTTASQRRWVFASPRSRQTARVSGG